MATSQMQPVGNNFYGQNLQNSETDRTSTEAFPTKCDNFSSVVLFQCK